MSRDDKASDPSGREQSDFVPAVFARAVEEAEFYRELLDDHDIPVRVGTDDNLDNEDADSKQAGDRGMTHGVPVLVPEALLDEASEIIADRDDLDEFDIEQDEEDEEEEDEGFGLEEPLEENTGATLGLDDEDEFLDDTDDSDEEWDDEEL